MCTVLMLLVKLLGFLSVGSLYVLMRELEIWVFWTSMSATLILLTVGYG